MKTQILLMVLAASMASAAPVNTARGLVDNAIGTTSGAVDNALGTTGPVVDNALGTTSAGVQGETGAANAVAGSVLTNGRL